MNKHKYNPELASEDISARWLHAVRDVRKPVSEPIPSHFRASLRALGSTLGVAVKPALLAVGAALAVAGVLALLQSILIAS